MLPKTSMKVALVIEQFDPRRGGAEQWTAQLAAQLLARRHEVHVVARRFGEQVRKMPIVAHCVPRTTTRPGFAEGPARRKIPSMWCHPERDVRSGPKASRSGSLGSP